MLVTPAIPLVMAAALLPRLADVANGLWQVAQFAA